MLSVGRKQRLVLAYRWQSGGDDDGGCDDGGDDVQVAKWW
jgi:hypothetical protein